MINQLKKVIQLIQKGQGNLILFALYNYVPFWLFRYFRIYVGFTDIVERDVNERIKRIMDRFEMRFATADDIELLRGLIPNKSVASFQERFDRHDTCGICIQNGKCLAVLWLCSERVQYEKKLNCKFLIPDNSAWVYDVYVHKNYRSRGIYMALALWVEANIEFDRYYGFMIDNNNASLKSHDRLGAKIVYEIRVFSLFGAVRHSLLDLTHPELGWKKQWTIGKQEIPTLDVSNHLLTEGAHVVG